MKVIGIDIMPGASKLSMTQARYAIAILENGNVKYKSENINFLKLLEIINREKPDLIAVDNIREIAPSNGDLAWFYEHIPPETKIVQVTKVSEDEVKSIVDLALEHKLIPFKTKLTPIQTAIIAAKLASQGIGSIIQIHAEETLIVVSRARTLKAGGMSSRRYERNISLLILRVARKIKEILDKNNIDYDVYVRKADVGLERCLFIVYAPRQRLKGLIKPMRGHDILVKIKEVRRQEIHAIPLTRTLEKSRPRRPLIVGVDPGVVTGIAIVDLNGRVLDVESRRYYPRTSIIETIRAHGVPVLLATDVAKPSMLVKKLAAMMNVKIFTPERDLTKDEKEELIARYMENSGNKFNITIRDTHQRDALAAALKAYYHFNPKFKQLEAKIKQLKLQEINLDEAKVQIIKGKSITEIILDLISDMLKRKSEKEKTLAYIPLERNKDLEILRQSYDKLKVEYQYLLHENNKLRQEVKELKRIIVDYFRQKRKPPINEALKSKVRMLESTLKSLEAKIDAKEKELLKIMTLLMEAACLKLTVVPILKSPSIQAVREIASKGAKIVFLENVKPVSEEALSKIAKLGLGILVSREVSSSDLELFENAGIPCIKVRIHEKIGNIAFVEGSIIDIVRMLRKKQKEIDRKLRKYSMEKIKDIIDTYRRLKIEN